MNFELASSSSFRDIKKNNNFVMAADIRVSPKNLAPLTNYKAKPQS